MELAGRIVRDAEDAPDSGADRDGGDRQQSANEPAIPDRPALDPEAYPSEDLQREAHAEDHPWLRGREIR